MKNPSKVKEFGMHLRRLRQAKGLSQQQLADLADISKITIQRIENAKFNVTLDTLISLSTALEIPLTKVFNF
ncbi:MAG: hypothetical protein RL065_456 [Bacteroidota bacterium]